MPRPRRILLHGDDVYYHLLSRTVGQDFLMGKEEKEHLLSLFSYYSSLYFVKLVGFSILDNHFHMVVKSETAKDYSQEEVERRIKIRSKKDSLAPSKQLEVIEKLENISDFMKMIKQNFARWYNKKHDRKGHFWSARFGGILLETGNAAMQCLAYVDLNPVRAKIVNLPEKYRWSSISARVNRAPISKNLSFGGLYGDTDLTDAKKLKLYRRYLYACGVTKKMDKGSIPKELADIEERLDFEIPKGRLLRSKVRHFTEGVAIGTESFIKNVHSVFKSRGAFKSRQKVYETKLSPKIMSFNKLRVLSC